jgi:outer membrane protein assembly factor BamB
MRRSSVFANAWLALAVVLIAGLATSQSWSQAPAPLEGPTAAIRGLIAAESGISGGLCVQVGAEDVETVAGLALSGHFLVQVLDADPQRVQEARRRFQASGIYGLFSVDQMSDGSKLPYTENLVNLLLVKGPDDEQVPPREAYRVLCPDGTVTYAPGQATAEQLTAAGFVDVRKSNPPGGSLLGRKPRPAGMDEWTHPRHSASGNAVSHDTLVAPPRRVRWVVGAQAEVPGMVTAAGRTFYGGVLARDGFNGLRLWHRDVIGPPSADGFTMKKLEPHNVPPVADGDRVYVVENKKLRALDAATGDVIREYPDAGEPLTVLSHKGTLIVATRDGVRALDTESAQLKWSCALSAPRYMVAGDDSVAVIQGSAARGESIEAVVLDLTTGGVRWKRNDLPWLPTVRRAVYHRGLIAYEVSTFNNDGPGNALHLVSATDGSVQLDHPFLPGMNHHRQARAMFLDDRMWLLHGGRGKDKERFPIQVSSLDLGTGETLVTHRAGLTHCFPPVMTSRYMLSGEFDLTDLATGETDAHQITKAACGRDGGWVPANGLIYVTPKHCVCWPMLRGYTALAPQRPAGSVADMDLKPANFVLESGVAAPETNPSEDSGADWPCYRHDPWRSGSTSAQAPAELRTLWSAELGDNELSGPIVEDWKENMFVKGPITSPVIAGNRVVVARPDAHEVVALDADSGTIAWRFTANGRVDTAPTLHRGLCLFGAKSGWVYCLRADDGRLVWRLRAAPVEEQMVAYGQLESPWPVPGSVLVSDDVAYFAAGRQSLADGGILIFAVDPPSGQIHWVRRLDSIPQKGFYECSGLEFDNFDLLHREGDKVGMSRWVFDRETGDMSLDRWAAFAKLNTGGGDAMVPRGCWSYAPRHQRRIPSFTHRRPLAVFRDNVLYGGLQGEATAYRRDFNLEGGETFDTRWITGWAASGLSRDGKMPWRSHRLAEKAAWRVAVFEEANSAPSIDAMLLAGERLLLAGSTGELRVLSTVDGKQLAQASLPAPLWDGMAVAHGRLYYSTRDGRLLCLGK